MKSEVLPNRVPESVASCRNGMHIESGFCSLNCQVKTVRRLDGEETSVESQCRAKVALGGWLKHRMMSTINPILRIICVFTVSTAMTFSIDNLCSYFRS